MQTRPLGKTGIQVTEIGFGSWAIGGATFRNGIPSGWAGADEKVSITAVERAWEAGINFYDTADAYGRGKSEVLLGLGLYNKRHDAIIATKVGMSMAAPGQNFTEPYVRGSLDSSMTRLERTSIELYQLHGPSVELMTTELFDVMRDLKASGKIRSWGVSVFTAEQALHAMAGGAEVIQLVYNILDQSIGNAVFPVAREKGVGIIVREALASGWLTGKFNANTAFPKDDHRSQKFPAERIKEISAKLKELEFVLGEADNMADAALRFVLSEPAVSTIIAGCKNPAQVEANARSAGKTLKPETVERIKQIFC